MKLIIPLLLLITLVSCGETKEICNNTQIVNNTIEKIIRVNETILKEVITNDCSKCQAQICECNYDYPECEVCEPIACDLVDLRKCTLDKVRLIREIEYYENLTNELTLEEEDYTILRNDLDDCNGDIAELKKDIREVLD